jgi:sulfur carrier protein ThiS
LNEVKVTVKLFSGLEKDLQNYDPAKGMMFEIRDGVTMKELIDSMHLPPHGARFASIGGEVKQGDYKLRDGDLVKIFNVIAGG